MIDKNQYINTKVMNRWIIDQYIGRGQSGVVYKAHGPQGETVAVKIISIPNEQQIKEGEIAYGGDRELMESFFDQIANKFVAETESLKQLSNSGDSGGQNIVRYIDHVASKRDMEWEIIIIMEFVMSLKEYFSAHRLDVGSVINLGIDIASGLEHCQGMKVIHRDIKDDNIFADAKGNFKIGDFGVAAMHTATRASTRVGTPYYMAPEVQRGCDYTSNVDVYSLGIVLYKLLNYGRFPFAPSFKEKPKLMIDDNDRAFKRRMAGEELPDPEFCPERLLEIIRRACAFNPAERYANASEMKAALMTVRNTMTKEEWEKELPAPKFMWKPNIGNHSESARGSIPVIEHNEQSVPIQPEPIPSASESTDIRSKANETQSPWGNNRDSVHTVRVKESYPYEEINDPGMKTTGMIEWLMKQGGFNATLAKKLAEKTRGQEKAEGEIRGLKRKSKNLKIGIAAAISVAVLAISAGAYLWPQTYSYNANSDDNYYLYKYQFGMPKQRILSNGTDPVPASYVKCDSKWIYFSLHDKAFSDDGDHRMFKIKKNGTDMVQLTDDHCEYNILYDGWIYYLSQLEGNALRRIRTDGTERQMLMDEARITSMFMEKNNGKIVIKMETGEEKVLDVNGEDIRISDLKTTSEG